MATYNVTGGAAVNFAPLSAREEILQNVRTILSTIKGSVPLNREFGIDGDAVDLPMPAAEAKLSNEIFRAIRRYEPRVSVESISFSGTIDGRLIPTVEVKINES